jgi:hypothetical protein
MNSPLELVKNDRNIIPKQLNANTLKIFQRMCMANAIDQVYALSSTSGSHRKELAFKFYKTSVDVIISKYIDIMPPTLVKSRDLMLRVNLDSVRELEPENLWTIWADSNKIVVIHMLPLWKKIVPDDGRLPSGTQGWDKFLYAFRIKYWEEKHPKQVGPEATPITDIHILRKREEWFPIEWGAFLYYGPLAEKPFVGWVRSFPNPPTSQSIPKLSRKKQREAAIEAEISLYELNEESPESRKRQKKNDSPSPTSKKATTSPEMKAYFLLERAQLENDPTKKALFLRQLDSLFPVLGLEIEEEEKERDQGRDSSSFSSSPRPGTGSDEEDDN